VGRASNPVRDRDSVAKPDPVDSKATNKQVTEVVDRSAANKATNKEHLAANKDPRSEDATSLEIKARREIRKAGNNTTASADLADKTTATQTTRERKEMVHFKTTNAKFIVGQ